LKKIWVKVFFRPTASGLKVKKKKQVICFMKKHVGVNFKSESIGEQPQKIYLSPAALATATTPSFD